MATCLVCGDTTSASPRAAIEHVRLIHPDLWDDAKPEHWMDGRPVWVDLTLTPDDFKESK